jgi:ketosteroid isomerase-like protein
MKQLFTTLALIGIAWTPALAEQRSYAEDRAAIEDLMARYLFAMDWNDFDAYADTFTEDGELEFSRASAKGREDIRQAAREFKQLIGKVYKDADGDPAILRHVIAQKVIRIEGDRAWSTSLWYEMANTGPEGSPEIGTFGIYQDELARVEGEWLFKRRKILNEFLEGRHSGLVNPVRTLDAAAASAKKTE